MSCFPMRFYHGVEFHGTGMDLLFSAFDGQGDYFVVIGLREGFRG